MGMWGSVYVKWVSVYGDVGECLLGCGAVFMGMWVSVYGDMGECLWGCG